MENNKALIRESYLKTLSENRKDYKVVTEIEEKLRKRHQRLLRMIAKSLDVPSTSVGFGSHSCDKSPVDLCIEDLREGECYCFYCGEPKERK